MWMNEYADASRVEDAVELLQHHAPVAQARLREVPEGNLAAPILAHGSMNVEYYAPVEVDRQTPHSRDELYVIASGTGWFVNGEQRHRFATGDVLFVPAGVTHRFEQFSPDFGTWVIFYGPEGGESG